MPLITLTWKSPKTDNIQTFCYKEFDCLYEHLATQFIHIINHYEDMSKCLTLELTHKMPKIVETDDPTQ